MQFRGTTAYTYTGSTTIHGGGTLRNQGTASVMTVPAGSQVPDLEAQAERIAAFLAVREVRVVRDPASARHAKVVVLRRDPLADPTPVPWPLASADRLPFTQNPF